MILILNKFLGTNTSTVALNDSCLTYGVAVSIIAPLLLSSEILYPGNTSAKTSRIFCCFIGRVISHIFKFEQLFFPNAFEILLRLVAPVVFAKECNL